MLQPDIRGAIVSDVPAIVAIVNDAYEHYVERIGRKPAPMSDDYERLVAIRCVWVLIVDGGVGGLIVLRRKIDHVLVGNVAVGRAFQGHGYGRKLMEHAENYALQNGFGELRLYTNELMHENLGIYTKLGWEEYDRAEQDGFHRIFMRKWIDRDLLGSLIK